MDTQRYELIAYVFMPEHVHLLVLPLDGATGVAGVPCSPFKGSMQRQAMGQTALGNRGRFRVAACSP
ncbi:MAG: hypothetical protein H6819_05510 [Phycisphaerales bacterium]|nr:hypothetical protein [Phycisphaerales bacterium]MCB9854763.1 hypothetical protein [Phycisphaerales bacterium]MCB9863765.1 hypothetical protein [Phycisphaerales bacterium]